MPTGIILSSGSTGATKEDIEKVLEKHGYETEKPESAAAAAEEVAEPKRADFKTEEEFETAKEAFAVEQEDAAAKAEEEEEEAVDPAAKPLSRRQRKARLLANEARTLRQELRQTKERLAALEARGQQPQPQAKTPEPPKREDFKSDAAFEEALFDYRYQLRRAKEAADQQVETQKQMLKETFEDYQASVAEFKEGHDDWDAVVNQDLPMHESVILAVMELENGPAVTYYLGKHPTFTKRLAELSPLTAVVEVGRLADRLKTGAPDRGDADSGTKPKPRPRIPAPITPVGGSVSASTLTSREAAQARNFKAFKAAQRKGV
jgi:hypothetical protein